MLKWNTLKVILLSISLNAVKTLASDNTYASTQISSSECYDNFGQPRVSFMPFLNNLKNITFVLKFHKFSKRMKLCISKKKN